MTTSSEEPAGDEYWRRPTAPSDDGPPHPRPGSAGPPVSGAGAPPAPYAGPPVGARPPGDWRPPLHVQPAPPRQLPPQDHQRLDADEQGARTLTYSVGMIAAAVLVVVICLLCSRIVF